MAVKSKLAAVKETGVAPNEVIAFFKKLTCAFSWSRILFSAVKPGPAAAKAIGAEFTPVL